jgi:hypothetical protein
MQTAYSGRPGLPRLPTYLRQSVFTLNLGNPNSKEPLPDRPRVHQRTLAFLGDAFLHLCASEYLYNRFPDSPTNDLHVKRFISRCF